ncbi:hypothetical protein [Desulfomicrobium salsuginis]
MPLRTQDWPGLQNASVSRKSASVRQEKSMRVKKDREKPGFAGRFEKGNRNAAG